GVEVRAPARAGHRSPASNHASPQIRHAGAPRSSTLIQRRDIESPSHDGSAASERSDDVPRCFARRTLEFEDVTPRSPDEDHALDQEGRLLIDHEDRAWDLSTVGNGSGPLTDGSRVL